MPVFNYGGGVGDGTSWSSESGNEPQPGGGSQGHTGDHDINNTTRPASNPTMQQYIAIQNDQAIRAKLAG